MALVNCPECGKPVSTQAAACPHCGVALAAPSGPVRGLGLSAAAVPPEQTLWEASPSARLLVGDTVATLAVVLTAVLLLAVGLPALLAALGQASRNAWVDGARAPLVLTVVLALYLALRGSRLALRGARLRSTRYRLTNQRLLVESGLVSRSMVEVDLRSVEDLVFHQGPLERLLGIGTVSVVSSDKGSPRLLLLGVKDPKATRELIRSQAYAASQRQLFTRST
ncbi:MAG: PH domain-containing protein [Myxococcaceae bacterium]